VSLQHEHGIFGGTDGEYILDFARALRVPLVTTLHTVLRRPSESHRNIVRELAERSARLVAINPRARVPLEHAYGLAGVAVQVIPHGIPDLPLVPPDSPKAAFGLEGRRVVLSFGLLAPSKNLDFAIRALPSVVAADPSIVYVIAGATHPGEIRANGEAYRHSLRDLADELGVSTHVRFIDRFLPAAELGELLLAADVYVVPYQHEEQISSGTLAFALGSGTAVVSTPFWHAQELLAGGCGLLVPFGDASALAREVAYLLTHDRERDEIRRRAYAATRGMTWPAVGEQYVSIFAEVTEASRSRSGRAAVMAG
jgi:glycosyltransferase involved in cell wall biosynthesis